MTFTDEDKGSCMKLDSLIPSVEEVLQDMVARDPFENCMTESHIIIDLYHEHPSRDQLILETPLEIDKKEGSVVIEEKMKTPDEFILQKLPKNGRQHKKASSHHLKSKGITTITNRAL